MADYAAFSIQMRNHELGRPTWEGIPFMGGGRFLANTECFSEPGTNHNPYDVSGRFGYKQDNLNPNLVSSSSSSSSISATVVAEERPKSKEEEKFAGHKTEKPTTGNAMLQIISSKLDPTLLSKVTQHCVSPKHKYHVFIDNFLLLEEDILPSGAVRLDKHTLFYRASLAELVKLVSLKSNVTISAANHAGWCTRWQQQSHLDLT
jgi:hypothetical protein